MSKVLEIRVKVCVPDDYKHEGDFARVLNDLEKPKSPVTFLDANVVEYEGTEQN